MSSSETAAYYTFSTISQTLGGAIAVLAAFVLYRFQLLNGELERAAEQLMRYATGGAKHQMEIALFEGRSDKMLRVAATAEPGSFIGIGGEQVQASQRRLAAVQALRAALKRGFVIALLLTVSLIAASVLALSATPQLTAMNVLGWTTRVAVAWCWACLASYIYIVWKALE